MIFKGGAFDACLATPEDVIAKQPARLATTRASVMAISILDMGWDCVPIFGFDFSMELAMIRLTHLASGGTSGPIRFAGVAPINKPSQNSQGRRLAVGA